MRLGLWTWWRCSAEVQTKHKKTDDLGDFDGGMGERSDVGFIHTDIFRAEREWPKKRLEMKIPC